MYKLINTPTPNGPQIGDYALRLSDGSFVHRELNEEYLKWIAEGNTPEPADQGE